MQKAYFSFVFIGTSAQCEQTRKTISLSSKDNEDQPTTSSDLTSGSKRNSSSTDQQNQQRQKQKCMSTTPAHQSQSSVEQRQNASVKKNISDQNPIKNNRIAEKTRTTTQTEMNEDKRDTVFVNQNNLDEKTGQQKNKGKKRKEFEEENQTIVKKKPLDSK